MQTVFVVIAVSSALLYLGVKAYKAFFSNKNSCEGCAFSKTVEDLK
jgi:hypothetical protein